MEREKTKKKMISVMVVIFAILMIIGIIGCRSKQGKTIADLRVKAAAAIEHVNLSYYDEREQGKIRAMVHKYLYNLDACTQKSEIEKLLSDFKIELGKVVTAEDKLIAIKRETIAEIENYDLSQYEKNGRKTIRKLIKKYCEKIEKAENADDVVRIEEQFKAAVAGVQTRAEKVAAEEKRKQEETEAKQENENTNKPVARPSRATAQQYIGKSVSQLIAAIGYPSSTSYAPSCLGEGEDGVWRYPGFTVYTYKERNREIVQGVG